MASMIGKPLHVDRMIETKTRLDFARVCIEINAHEEILHGFTIQGEGDDCETIAVEVVYQCIPERCGQCCVFEPSAKR